jgi:amino-acid N-acetyltransferase
MPLPQAARHVTERPFEFRPAQSTDESRIVELLRVASLPLDGVHEMLHDDPSQFVLAFRADAPGLLVAIAAIEICGGDALLRSVAVHPAHRGSGLGVAIAQHAIQLAHHRQIGALYLLTTTAAAFFPKLGFERIARDSVPPAIAATVEFVSACPASATTMRKVLVEVG